MRVSILPYNSAQHPTTHYLSLKQPTIPKLTDPPTHNRRTPQFTTPAASPNPLSMNQQPTFTTTPNQLPQYPPTYYLGTPKPTTTAFSNPLLQHPLIHYPSSSYPLLQHPPTHSPSISQISTNPLPPFPASPNLLTRKSLHPSRQPNGQQANGWVRRHNLHSLRPSVVEYLA